MTKYNEIVSKVRDLARDGVRLQAVNRYRTNRYQAEQDKASLEASIAEEKKNIARAEFKKSQLVEADPDFSAKVADQDANIKYHEEAIARLEKSVEATDKLIAEITEKIEKVETGETKMSIDKVEEATKQLLDEFVKEQVKAVVA